MTPCAGTWASPRAVCGAGVVTVLGQKPAHATLTRTCSGPPAPGPHSEQRWQFFSVIDNLPVPGQGLEEETKGQGIDK